MNNIFFNIPDKLKDEFFETLLDVDGVKIERIVSSGQGTPKGEWLFQEKNEWVILLEGSAELLFKDEDNLYKMIPGDYIYVKAGREHRVQRTDPEKKTVWVAVHF
ncbi:MAG: cupin domain-containing protein [Candidatus Omnitrophica bacterium]|nr:cupin domain-containing protein [Candidatus Omnitrophota bacterium]